jgi:hypothetical protein
MNREAFEKWAITQGLGVERDHTGESYESLLTDGVWAGWQAALQSGEPVARVIDDGTSEGATEWIPFCNRTIPLKTGDLLYTTTQPVVPDETMVAALCEIAKWIENSIGHKNHPVSFIARKALLSAGKGGE